MVVDPDQADETVDESDTDDEDRKSGLRNRLSWWLRRLAPVKY
jgi:hypothetical protein